MRFLRAIEFRQTGTIRLFYEACELKEGKRKERKKVENVLLYFRSVRKSHRFSVLYHKSYITRP